MAKTELETMIEEVKKEFTKLKINVLQIQFGYPNAVNHASKRIDELEECFIFAIQELDKSKEVISTK